MDMVRKHTSYEVHPVCLSNVPAEEFRDDIEIIPLQHDWPIWWAKIEMFNPDLPLQDRVLSLDIDQIVVGDLDELIEYPVPIGIMNYWSYSTYASAEIAIRKTREKWKSILIPKYSSDAIIFDKGMCAPIYDQFNRDIMLLYYGDQDWIAACLGPNLPKFPKEWGRKMKKRDRGDGSIKFGPVKLLACHPIKNHQMLENGYIYMDQLWRGIT